MGCHIIAMTRQDAGGGPSKFQFYVNFSGPIRNGV
jgi:hypothetical protein